MRELRSASRALAILGLPLLLACSEGAHVLRLAHGLDVGHPVHRAMRFMEARLGELSGGRLRLEIHPSEQLGSERECLELLQIGSLAMTKVSAAVLENFAPPFRVFGVPYLFRDDAHRFQVLGGPLGKELLHGLEPYRLRGLAYFDAGSRSFYTRDRPVRSPDDLAGLKIRVQESPTAIALVRSLGAGATPIAWGELYTALQQGVVDGAENNPPSFHLSRHYEVARHLSLDRHTAVPDVLLVSRHAWRRLDAEERGWLERAADEAAEMQKALWKAATADALRAVEADGVTIHRPDPAGFAARVAELRTEPALAPQIAALVERIAEIGR